MPRHDWNTPAAHSQKPHHKRMHSPAKGRGHDKKLKAVKRGIRDLCPHCHNPVTHRRDRRAHANGEA